MQPAGIQDRFAASPRSPAQSTNCRCIGFCGSVDTEDDIVGANHLDRAIEELALGHDTHVIHVGDHLGSRRRLLTAAEVAELLAVPESWVREHTRDGSLPRVQLGRYVRYRREAVLAWLESTEATGARTRAGQGPRGPQ